MGVCSILGWGCWLPQPQTTVVRQGGATRGNQPLSGQRDRPFGVEGSVSKMRRPIRKKQEKATALSAWGCGQKFNRETLGIR